MVGCRYNAKNTLPKNYLYFAEKLGVHILPEVTVRDIRPLTGQSEDGARYEVVYRKTTAWIFHPPMIVRARNVIVAAGALGTLELLFRCREQTHSLPRLSQRLGYNVRTNSENLQGAVSREGEIDYSKGIAITSIFSANGITNIEPVRFSDGSSLIRNITAPLVDGGTVPDADHKDLLGNHPSPHRFSLCPFLFTLGASYDHPINDATRGRAIAHAVREEYIHPVP